MQQLVIRCAAPDRGGAPPRCRFTGAAAGRIVGRADRPAALRSLTGVEPVALHCTLTTLRRLVADPQARACLAAPPAAIRTVQLGHDRPFDLRLADEAALWRLLVARVSADTGQRGAAHPQSTTSISRPVTVPAAARATASPTVPAADPSSPAATSRAGQVQRRAAAAATGDSGPGPAASVAPAAGRRAVIAGRPARGRAAGPAGSTRS